MHEWHGREIRGGLGGLLLVDCAMSHAQIRLPCIPVGASLRHVARRRFHRRRANGASVRRHRQVAEQEGANPEEGCEAVTGAAHGEDLHLIREEACDRFLTGSSAASSRPTTVHRKYRQMSRRSQTSGVRRLELGCDGFDLTRSNHWRLHASFDCLALAFVHPVVSTDALKHRPLTWCSKGTSHECHDTRSSRHGYDAMRPCGRCRTARETVRSPFPPTQFTPDRAPMG
jgi:hypothetical protein